MNQKVLASFAVITLLFGMVSGVAFADDKSSVKTRQAQSKPSDQKNCANDLNSIKKLLESASDKLVALKQKLYSEWQSSSSSGQTKDDWSAYAKKLEVSQEMQDYMSLQEKYNTLSASCPAPATKSESKVTFTKSNECVNAQRMVDSIDQKYSVLKQNAYDTWKSQNAAGTYPGTWDQFANEFINSSPVTELNQVRQKYDLILRTCYTQTNVITPIPTETQSQSCPDSDIQSVQSMLSAASQKIAALREKIYSEWKSSYDSGKTKDGWDSYSKKNLDGSQEFANFQQLKQKLDLLYKTCKAPAVMPQTSEPAKPINPEPSVQFTKSDECVIAKSTLDSIDQKYSILKQNAYDTWKSQNAAGAYPGTWDQYADENLVKSPDVLDLAKMREKYEPFLRTCYVQSGGNATPDSPQAKPQTAPEKTTLTESKTKPPTPDTTVPSTASMSKTKPLSTPAKTDQKQPAKTDAAKKQDMLSKLTKAKHKIIKKPVGLSLQK